ncbi:hypothetical protein Hdeb2414_s0068g00769241 [Helianthus debilis subsp. tardiflorus]
MVAIDGSRYSFLTILFKYYAIGSFGRLVAVTMFEYRYSSPCDLWYVFLIVIMYSGFSMLSILSSLVL